MKHLIVMLMHNNFTNTGLNLGNHAIWLALTLFMVAGGVTLTFYAPKQWFKNIHQMAGFAI